jgi:FKBP-type peptidyl-prolyl cis-trans isomerase SlyD
MKIAEKKIVSVTYDLYVDSDSGKPELMESATKDAPLTFCFGIGMMLPKFEEHLLGKKVGDKFDFVIKSEDAYGNYEDEGVMDLPKSIFEVDGKFDNEMVVVDQIVPLMDSEGNRLNAMVVSIGEDTVKVDLNHPLAGEDLHFKGEVIEVRDATEQELNMFLNPGCGGGCGGGCSSTDDCGEKSCGCGN